MARTNLVDETTSEEEGDHNDIDRHNIEDMNQIISEFAETDIDPYDAEDDEIKTNKKSGQSTGEWLIMIRLFFYFYNGLIQI